MLDDGAGTLQPLDQGRRDDDWRTPSGDVDNVADPDARDPGFDGAAYFTTPFALRKSRATSFGSIFSPSTL
jgi:hypothetical protein